MLVLSRKVGERLLIGDNIVVKVLRVRPGHIRLGISAPPGILVRREELAGPRTGRAAAGPQLRPVT
jgi:carbon storage regulator